MTSTPSIVILGAAFVTLIPLFLRDGLPSLGIEFAPGTQVHVEQILFGVTVLGVKRAAYALLTGEAISPQQALEWGMVNEVVPRDQLIPRAYAIADHIMTQPRTTRRLTTQIVRRPWKQRIVNDLDGGFGIQMFGHVAKKKSIHGEGHIKATVDYVRDGRKNNFD